MKEVFIQKSFHRATLATIEQANAIIDEYQLAGFTLTVRQLYYQFVARDLIPNTDRSYKNLGKVVNDARLAGLIDWDAIEDRTRFLRSNSHWSTGADVIDSCAQQFQLDKWENQSHYIEVWIEKDALIGVIEAICQRLDVPYFACRGYSSQSEQWRAGQRLQAVIDQGRIPLIIHLGDHDPSGIDMTRDNQDRLSLFAWNDVQVERIALNWDQIEQYQPPPNSAKLSDTRAKAYIEQYGAHSWELDALDPRVIESLIEAKVEQYRDPVAWQTIVDREQAIRFELSAVQQQLEQRGI